MESGEGLQDHSCCFFYFKFYFMLKHLVGVFRHDWIIAQLCILKWVPAVVRSVTCFIISEAITDETLQHICLAACKE